MRSQIYLEELVYILLKLLDFNLEKMKEDLTTDMQGKSKDGGK